MEQYDEQVAVKLFEGLATDDDFVARMTVPAQTAIEAAMHSQRITPVYGSGVEQSNPDAWTGQPNSAL